MIAEIPKRVAIIGLPGSGKSTFAFQLGKLLNIPVHHLDVWVFENGKKRKHEDFLIIKKKIVNEESWIIEGCSFSTLEMRFARADCVIYFQLPRLVCIKRILKRTFCFNEILAKSGCLRGINWTLLKYMWNFERNKKTEIQALKIKYPAVEFIVFRHQKDITKFLEEIQNSQKLTS